MIEPIQLPHPRPEYSGRPDSQTESQKADRRVTSMATPSDTGAAAELHGSPSDPAASVASADTLNDLGDQIALLSSHIQAATYRLLVMIRKFDDQEGWNCGGRRFDFRSCAHWLNWRTGLDIGAAREKVRVARALGELPSISEAMRRGELSYSKVRALTRVATPENEEELLQFAKTGTASHVEKLVRAWRRVDRSEELELENQRRASRYLSTYTDEDGMLVLRARLEPEVGAAVLKALEAAEKVLFEKSRETEETESRSSGDGMPVEQRRADAIGLVAESALAHGLDKSTRGDRLQVVVHVDEPVLKDPAQAGISMLEEGQSVSAETSRRLACDSSKVVMRHDSEGRTLDVGRKTRTISTALRRALAHRDKTCQFPGCDLEYCDAHHVKHWAEGGETKLDNLVLLCRRHHRAVHEGGYTVKRCREGNEWRFFRPDAQEMVAAPPTCAIAIYPLSDGSGFDGLPPEPSSTTETSAEFVPPGSAANQAGKGKSLTPDPQLELETQLATDGVTIGAMTGYPEWDGRSWDLQMAVQGYRQVGKT